MLRDLWISFDRLLRRIALQCLPYRQVRVMENFFDFLNFPLMHVGENTVTLGQLLYVPSFVLVGAVLIRWSARLLRRYLRRRSTSPDLIQFLSRAWVVASMGVLAISTLDLINIPLTAFAFVSGAVAIGLGFGAQNIINNFISGWILMWERPIRIGDFLEVGEMRGTVEAINTRSTAIRRVDGVHMLVPNSHLLENTIINWTLIDQLTRGTVRVGVAYGSPVRRVAELLEQAAQEHTLVLIQEGITVVFEDFGDNSLIFDLHFWVNAERDRGLRIIRSDLRFRIDELFNENNIVISFPQRDIHLDGELRITQAPRDPS